MNETPTVSPVILLLRSRKFLAILFGLVFDMAIAFIPSLVPTLAPFRDQLIFVSTALVIAFVGGTTIEDAAQKLGDAKVEAARHQAMATKSLIAATSSPENGADGHKS